MRRLARPCWPLLLAGRCGLLAPAPASAGERRRAGSGTPGSSRTCRRRATRRTSSRTATAGSTPAPTPTRRATTSAPGSSSGRAAARCCGPGRCPARTSRRTTASRSPTGRARAAGAAGEVDGVGADARRADRALPDLGDAAGPADVPARDHRTPVLAERRGLPGDPQLRDLGAGRGALRQRLRAGGDLEDPARRRRSRGCGSPRPRSTARVRHRRAGLPARSPRLPDHASSRPRPTARCPTDGKLYRLPLRRSGAPGPAADAVDLAARRPARRLRHRPVRPRVRRGRRAVQPARRARRGRARDRPVPPVPGTGENGSAIPFDTPSSATFLGTRVLVANQSFFGDTSHHADPRRRGRRAGTGAVPAARRHLARDPAPDSLTHHERAGGTGRQGAGGAGLGRGAGAGRRPDRGDGAVPAGRARGRAPLPAGRGPRLPRLPAAAGRRAGAGRRPGPLPDARATRSG